MIGASFRWMFLIIGTTIGAGYASGREIWQFFGHESGLAILLFGVLFSACCYTIMSIGYSEQSSHYVVILQQLVGKRLQRVYDVLIFFYLFSVTVVMIAGSGASGEVFQLPYGYGIGLILISLMFVFLKEVEGVLSANQWIVPFLILSLLVILISFIRQEQISFSVKFRKQSNWYSAFPFTAFNILPLIAVLGAIGKKIRSKGEIILSSIGSGFILAFISFLYNTSLIQIAWKLEDYEIPLYALLESYSKQTLVWMAFVLWVAIFTTATSGVLGIATRVQSYKEIPIKRIVPWVLFTMIPFTFVGFSTLIKYLYPFYGILNLYILIKLIFAPLEGVLKK